MLLSLLEAGEKLNLNSFKLLAQLVDSLKALFLKRLLTMTMNSDRRGAENSTVHEKKKADISVSM